ncbi:TPA: hypothetical protein ACS3CI_003251 [Legionella pneumophila]
MIKCCSFVVKALVLIICIFLVHHDAFAYPARIGLAGGYEAISGLSQSQNTNLLTRISLSKELSSIGREKSEIIYFGIEVAGRTGFYGSLNISDAIQDDIGGPTPVIYSTPRLELLATTRKYISADKVFMFGSLGIDFSILKFDRCDLANSNIVNLLGYVGFGLELNKKSELNIAISKSKPMSQLQFSGYSIANPYTQTAILIGFSYKL